MFRLQGRAAGTVAQPAATIEPALWLRFFKQAWTAKKFALIDRSLGADDAMKLGILHTQPKPPKAARRPGPPRPRHRRRGRPAAAALPHRQPPPRPPRRTRARSRAPRRAGSPRSTSPRPRPARRTDTTATTSTAPPPTGSAEAATVTSAPMATRPAPAGPAAAPSPRAPRVQDEIERRLTDGGRDGWLSWERHVTPAAGCARPVRLRGQAVTVNTTTGEVVDTYRSADAPDGLVYKPCGTRRASVCPSCARTYQYDAYHLLKAGLAGSRSAGVPEDVALRPVVLLTLTAPSFGPRPRPPHAATGSRCPAAPAGTSRCARTAGPPGAPAATAPATRSSASRCAWTATTTTRTSSGTTTPPNCGAAPPSPCAAPSPASGRRTG